MEKAVIYARVSTEDQAQNGVSLDAQVSGCLEYVMSRGLELFDTVVDAGISGKSTERPGLQRLLSLVEKKKVQHVVTLKLDRLSRSTLDSLSLMAVFNRKEVQLHLVSENGSVNSENPDDEFLMTLKAGLAQLERKKISERTKYALDRKRQLKQRISLNPPYGFSFVDGKVVHNPSEQRVISKIHRLHSRGSSIRKIIEEFSRRNIFNRQGKPFQVASIYRILKKTA